MPTKHDKAKLVTKYFNDILSMQVQEVVVDTDVFGTVESYLDHQASKLAQRFDANTYIALTEAMNSHDIGRERGGVAAALATIKVPVVAVSIDTDRLFPVRLQAEIAELAPAAAPLVTISSPFGHDGFLVEVESVGHVIREALNLAK